MQASLFEAEMTGAACAHEHAIRVLPMSDEVLYYPHFLSPFEADSYLRELRSEIAWRQEEITLYGKRHPVPRLTAWYGDPGASYTYSGIKNEPNLWTPVLHDLLLVVRDATNVEFNSVLLNLYRDGSDSLSWHSDDEPELGSHPVIASISLGAPRLFALRHVGTKARSTALHLGHGSLLVMSGNSQKNFQHAIPKEKRVAGERINLTFRVIGEGKAKEQPLRRTTS